MGLLWDDQISISSYFYNKNFFHTFEITDVSKSDDILLWLEIPRINLKEKVYQVDSSFNDVSLHVQILEDSEIERYFFLFAGHSGNGNASYFNDLKYVQEGDVVLITLEQKVLYYLVEDIFYIYKNGYFSVPLREMQDTLYLITCSLDYPSKQLIVKAKLVY